MNRRGFFKSLSTIVSAIALYPAISKPIIDEGINYNLHINTKAPDETILVDFRLLKAIEKKRII